VSHREEHILGLRWKACLLPISVEETLVWVLLGDQNKALLGHWGGTSLRFHWKLRLAVCLGASLESH
jgi:hypothetical protein